MTMMLQLGEEVAKKKQVQLRDAVPTEWRLSEDLTSSITVEASTEVRKIPKTCSILDEKEVDITKNYSST